MNTPSTTYWRSGATITKRFAMPQENMLIIDDQDAFCEVQVNTLERC